jgi:hypothetical protein
MQTGPIVQAVTLEVERLSLHPKFHPSEGAAYKAAWDRAGSDALKHCEAFRRDCLIASLFAAYPGECVGAFVARYPNLSLDMARENTKPRDWSDSIQIRGAA